VRSLKHIFNLCSWLGHPSCFFKIPLIFVHGSRR